ncbi:MAG: alpha/beta hydrolase [Cyclobacteriaceae bacterium]|nr:alpha/beta hydrolase [Cyclobacteriaceae bacterium]
MASSDHFFHYKKACLHYSKTGDGRQVALLFHGFGQDRTVYNQLAVTHFSGYTVYAFDLFFHGQSTWGYDEDTLEKSFWLACIGEFLKSQGIEKFSVMGFSLGARLALTLTEGFPEQVQHLYLLAPDGIKTSFWYSLATYPVLARKLFKSMINRPKLFYGITKTLNRLNLLNKELYYFAGSQMNTEEKRSRVYHTWVVFRHLSFDLKKITGVFNQNKLPVTLILGRFDKVITGKSLKQFIDRVPHIILIELTCRHNDLIRVFANAKLSDQKA